jgi:hypothetical protein
VAVGEVGALARVLRIPVSTRRNREQGRKVPDPAARTVLALVAADTVHALALLPGETPRAQDGTHTARSGAGLCEGGQILIRSRIAAPLPGVGGRIRHASRTPPAHRPGLPPVTR